jgi:hypothetical protein
MTRTLGRVALVFACFVAATGVGRAQTSGAPHLVLEYAEVEERLPPRSEPVLVFRAVVHGAPPCSAARSNVSYTFFLDTDRTRTTGTRTKAIPEIGIERSVVIRCDFGAGRFTSASGPVTLTMLGGASPMWELAVSVPRRILPTFEFDWVAIAQEDVRFDRLPSAGEALVWRTLAWQW